MRSQLPANLLSVRAFARHRQTSNSLSWKSAFDRSCEDTLGEVSLQERIHNQDRDQGDDQDGHLDRRLRRQPIKSEVLARQLSVIDDVRSQDELDGPLRLVIDVQQGTEEGVPVADGVEESDDRQDGLRERKDDEAEGLPVASAVDRGALHQLSWEIHEEG